MKLEFTVPSMSCKHCVAHIEEALKDSGKARAWNVDLGTKLVTVETDESRETVAAVLAEAGYAPA